MLYYFERRSVHFFQEGVRMLQDDKKETVFFHGFDATVIGSHDTQRTRPSDASILATGCVPLVEPYARAVRTPAAHHE